MAVARHFPLARAGEQLAVVVPTSGCESPNVDFLLFVLAPLGIKKFSFCKKTARVVLGSSLFVNDVSLASWSVQSQ